MLYSAYNTMQFKLIASLYKEVIVTTIKDIINKIEI